MKLIKPLFLLMSFLLSFTVFGQEKLTWKKHVKLAEGLAKDAKYADAGTHYLAAWRQKSKSKEYVFQAGECFYIVRDYKNAANAYQHVKDDNDKYPQVGLKYARCLKQSGDYEAAVTAFNNFIQNYKGTDKTVIAAQVQTEIKGCELAQEVIANNSGSNVEWGHLGETVNTPETEFAPFPFNDEILYFSSTMAKRAEIYRTKQVDGQWTQAKVPSSFPQVKEGHFCNGSLAPDQKRFYFTICKSVESWGGLTTQCEIFVTKRLGSKWSSPERLRDYINMEGTTTTHPFVVYQGNTEVLYFASNRTDGNGGMDIWYSTRDLNSAANDFSYPTNLGPNINTAANEITPYYSNEEEQLYFASDGRVALGGYDIFKSSGNKTQWAQPVNLGLPYNSSADDFYFTKTPSGQNGFFVSNRTYGTAKVTTTDEDIFSFVATNEREVFAEGGVYDKETGEILTDVSISLYELFAAGNKRLIKNERYESGRYKLMLSPESQYAIEAQKEGFYPMSYEFTTDEYLKYQDFGEPLFLAAIEGQPVVEEKPAATIPTPVPKETLVEPVVEAPSKEIVEVQKEAVVEAVKEKVEIIEEPVVEQPVVETPVVETPVIEKATIIEELTAEEIVVEDEVETVVKESPKEIYRPLEEVIVEKETQTTTVRTNVSPRTTTATPTANSPNNNDGTKYIIRGKSSRDNYEVITSAPRHQGTYYKIQLIAVKTFDIKHSRYRPVETMGRLDTEYIVDKKLTRVLLAYYGNLSDAKADLSKVRTFNNYERAYIVKYIDGERIGRVN